MGQEGSYIITDPEEQSLGLPKGKYDFPIVIGAKLYHDDGSLRYDTNNSIGLWGDIIQVYVCGGCCIVVSTKKARSNGQPWPYVKVEPRKYRFRVLNGAVSRSKDKVVEIRLYAPVTYTPSFPSFLSGRPSRKWQVHSRYQEVSEIRCHWSGRRYVPVTCLNRPR
jgi:hypothetical protein